MKVVNKLPFESDLHLYIFTQLNDLFHWGVTPSDLKLLAELYNADYEMLATGNVKLYTDRMAIIFSSEFKQKLMEKLGVSYNSFYNSLTRLKKKSLLNKDNTLNEKMLFNLSKDSFTFTIECINEKGSKGIT